MFTKARNKILMLNMVLVSAVMLAAFVLVYIAQYSRIQSENRSRLEAGGSVTVFGEAGEVERGQTGPMDSMEPPFVDEDAPGNDASLRQEMTSVRSTFLLASDGIYFTALTDSKGNILALNTVLDMSPELYEETVTAAVSQGKESGTVSTGGSYWQYLVTVLHVQTQINGMEETKTESFHQIRFLDITDSRNTLSTLLVTLIVVFLVLLVAVYFISRFFANRAIQPMAQAWEKQNRFVADASHELRTPLSVINANCGVLLANREETVESQIKWITRIGEGTGRMAGLVDNLLSLANVEDAQFEVVLSDCDLSAVAEDTAAAVEATALDKGIELKSDIEPGVHMKTDFERVRQVMSILLDNAIKYSPENGVIDVKLCSGKKTVTWSVSNAGEAIRTEELSKLFDRFYRGDPARNNENAGYGLGLSIAKAVAEQLNGNIYVDIQDEVITFSFTLKRHSN